MPVQNEETVAANFEKYVNLVDKFGETQISSMIENEGARLATSPSNAQKDEHGCFNGGMIQDTLDILEAMRKLEEQVNQKAISGKPGPFN